MYIYSLSSEKHTYIFKVETVHISADHYLQISFLKLAGHGLVAVG